MKRRNNFFTRLSPVTRGGILFTLAGLMVIIYGYLEEVGIDGLNWRTFVIDLYANLGVELCSIGITVLVIDRLNRHAADREQLEEFTWQMRSHSYERMIGAVEGLRFKGWLHDGSLRGIYLARTKLNKTPLEEASLQNACLIGANLHEAGLCYANLQEACLVGANLQHTDLEGANLQGAYLNKVSKELLESFDYPTPQEKRSLQEFVSELENKQVLFDENTTLPDGSKWAPEADMTRFTNPYHPKFWRSDDPLSPAYKNPPPQ
jgi:hypothetical protein